MSQILLVMKMKVNSVLQSLTLIKSFQYGLMKLRTACIYIVLPLDETHIDAVTGLI